jgi:hypothetical protein
VVAAVVCHVHDLPARRAAHRWLPGIAFPARWERVEWYRGRQLGARWIHPCRQRTAIFKPICGQSLLLARPSGPVDTTADDDAPVYLDCNHIVAVTATDRLCPGGAPARIDQR